MFRVLKTTRLLLLFGDNLRVFETCFSLIHGRHVDTVCFVARFKLNTILWSKKVWTVVWKRCSLRLSCLFEQLRYGNALIFFLFQARRKKHMSENPTVCNLHDVENERMSCVFPMSFVVDCCFIGFPEHVFEHTVVKFSIFPTRKERARFYCEFHYTLFPTHYPFSPSSSNSWYRVFLQEKAISSFIFWVVNTPCFRLHHVSGIPGQFLNPMRDRLKKLFVCSWQQRCGTDVFRRLSWIKTRTCVRLCAHVCTVEYVCAQLYVQWCVHACVHVCIRGLRRDVFCSRKAPQ